MGTLSARSGTVSKLPSSDRPALSSVSQVEDEGSESREQFGNRWAFWLTAVGCSVGFGNVWRFPYLTYNYGGAAFLIPYIILILIVLFPLSILEFGAGQAVRGGTIKMFASMGNKRLISSGGFTWMIVFVCSFFYPLLLCWSMVYFANSFKSSMPWSTTDEEMLACGGLSLTACTDLNQCSWQDGQCVGYVLNRAKWFFESIEGCNASPVYDGIDNFSWRILISQLLTWGLCCLAVLFGTRVLGKINYVTMTMPTVCFIILLGVGCSLPGANIGIKNYIGKLEIDKLADLDTWSAALGQGLFSVGVAQGTMPVLGSHNAVTQNFVQDALVVVAADTIYAFVAGFIVFTVIGYLSYDSQIEFSKLPLQGTGLAFQTYPVGLSSLGYPWAQILCVLFFATLWLLGATTVVGYFECMVDVMIDCRLNKKLKISRKKSCLMITGFFLTFHLLLCTDMGTWILDSIDHFNGGINMPFLAAAEAFVVGWLFYSQKPKEIVGRLASNFLLYGWNGPMLVGLIVATAISSPGESQTVPHIIVGVSFIVSLCCLIGALFLTKTEFDGKPLSWKDRAWYLYLENLDFLRRRMNNFGCRGRKFWRVGLAWVILVKYIIPPVMFAIMASFFTSPSLMFEYPNPINPYPAWLFFVGFVFPVAIVIQVVVFAIVPKWIMFLVPDNTDFDLLVAEDKEINFDNGRRIRDVEKSLASTIEPSPIVTATTLS